MKHSNIYLIGPMAAGKSTIGRSLATHLGRPFYDSDQYIEEKTGADLGWIFDIEGESGFRQRETDALKALTQKQGVILATGGGSVHSEENRNALTGNGTVVHLQISLDHQYARTKLDKKRPLLQTEDKKERLQAIQAKRQDQYESIANFTFNTDSKSAKQVVLDIVQALDLK